MPRLFLSYRRSDSQMVAGRLREWLAERMGQGAVFRDKESIGAGEDWTRAIRESLSGRDVTVLALIDRGWADARDEQGRRRLDDPQDWNRRELEIALEQGRRLIPVLIDGAPMPAEADLPPSLRPLTRLNAMRLRDDDWETDSGKIARALGVRTGSMRHAWRVAALAMVLAGAGGWWWWHSPPLDDVAMSPTPTGKPLSREEVKQKLVADQFEAMKLFGSDPARAKRIIDDNFDEVDKSLKAAPNDLELHTLAGYAAKNVYMSSKGVLMPEARSAYLLRAQHDFEHVLALAPDDAGAVNGMGNVRYFQRRFDEAIALHRRAIELTQGRYPAAQSDLDLVQRVKSGAQKFDP